MKYLCMIIVALILAAAIDTIASTRTKDQSAIDRGKYLVNNISVCVDCHTPMLPNGTFDQKKLLSGTPLFFKPVNRTPNWAPVAPNLTPAGFLRNWSNKQLVKFLMTGMNPDGKTADPPMPQFRMKKSDAQGVAAYLRSLPSIKRK